MTTLDTAQPVASLSGKAQATCLGLTQVTGDRLYGLCALVGHGLMGASGKFSGNGWEMFTGISWASSSVAMALWPGRSSTIKYVGWTVIAGSVTLAIGALNKEHHAGQWAFCALAIARSSLLVLDPKRFQDSPAWQFFSRNKKELNGSVAFPSRLGLLWDAACNGQPLLVVTAVLYQVCDIALIASGLAEKRTKALQAAHQRGGR